MLAIYGLVVSVLIVGKVNTDITNYTGFKLMGAGLTNGFSGLAAGYCTGVIAESGLDGTSKQPKLFVGMVLMLAWCQALGLYGLLAALIMGAS